VKGILWNKRDYSWERSLSTNARDSKSSGGGQANRKRKKKKGHNLPLLSQRGWGGEKPKHQGGGKLITLAKDILYRGG